MTDALWRLLWALPLVLALGVGAMFALGRLVRTGARPDAGRRLRHLESLALADGARLHLVELDRRALVLAESAQGVVQLRLPGEAGAGAPARGLFAARRLP